MTECGCITAGTDDDPTCDASGQCNCKDNIGGEKCNECIGGYYGFPDCKRKCVAKSLLFFNQKWKYIFPSWMAEIPNTYT